MVMVPYFLSLLFVNKYHNRNEVIVQNTYLALVHRIFFVSLSKLRVCNLQVKIRKIFDVKLTANTLLYGRIVDKEVEL